MASSLDITPALGHGLVTAQNQPGGYDAIDDRRQWSVGKTEGALSPLAYKVTQKAEGANLSVDVLTNEDHFLVQGDDVDFQGLYLIPATALKANLDLADPPDITNPRVDFVVLEADDDAHTSSGNTRGRVYVLSGTPTSGADVADSAAYEASKPTLPPSTALLAEFIVDANATSITDADIRDRRGWALGFMEWELENQTADLVIGGLDGAVDGQYVLDIVGRLTRGSGDTTLFLFPNNDRGNNYDGVYSFYARDPGNALTSPANGSESSTGIRLGFTEWSSSNSMHTHLTLTGMDYGVGGRTFSAQRSSRPDQADSRHLGFSSSGFWNGGGTGPVKSLVISGWGDVGCSFTGKLRVERRFGRI